jgi:hypothetical protein
MGDPERLLRSRSVNPLVRDLLETFRSVSPAPSASLKVWRALAAKIAALHAAVPAPSASALPDDGQRAQSARFIHNDSVPLLCSTETAGAERRLANVDHVGTILSIRNRPRLDRLAYSRALSRERRAGLQFAKRRYLHNPRLAVVLRRLDS